VKIYEYGVKESIMKKIFIILSLFVFSSCGKQVLADRDDRHDDRHEDHRHDDDDDHREDRRYDDDRDSRRYWWSS
jgi:ABC-type Zn2+ transport system substrate-binding protein/surface adhesin